MKRRRLLNTLVRMLTAWVLLMVQGVCDSAHFAVFAFAPSPASIACAMPVPSREEQEAHHARLCHCRMCRGPKQCCCATAKSDTERTAFRAICDTPQEQALPGAVGPIRALPPVPTLIACGWGATLPLQPPPTMGRCHTRCPEPITPPPSA